MVFLLALFSTETGKVDEFTGKMLHIALKTHMPQSSFTQ